MSRSDKDEVARKLRISITISSRGSPGSSSSGISLSSNHCRTHRSSCWKSTSIPRLRESASSTSAQCQAVTSHSSVIVEVTPDEFERIQSQELKLPDGWTIDEEYPKGNR